MPKSKEIELETNKIVKEECPECKSKNIILKIENMEAVCKDCGLIWSL